MCGKYFKFETESERGVPEGHPIAIREKIILNSNTKGGTAPGQTGDEPSDTIKN